MMMKRFVGVVMVGTMFVAALVPGCGGGGGGSGDSSGNAGQSVAAYLLCIFYAMFGVP